MSSSSAKHIAVLMGGPSSEREVSLVSGRICATTLRKSGYQVTEIDAGLDLAQRLSNINPDVAFNALHGRWGEDGCVQGMLEWLGIPYTHSGVRASSMAMDKEITKQLAYKRAGLPSPQGQIIDLADLENNHNLPTPYVIKPINEGSSFGVTIVNNEDNPSDLYSERKCQQVLAEQYIPGRELTVTVLQDKPLAVTEIISEDWYDYRAKYQPGGSKHIIPAEIPTEIYRFCMDAAQSAHQVLGCRGISRTDFRWDDCKGKNGVFLLETNTQPGMTPTSLSPEQAQYCEITFQKLCDLLVEDASCQR